MLRIALLSLALAACGSSGAKSVDATTDSPKSIDARADAPPDSPPDAMVMADGTHYHYVIDSLAVPQSTMQATQYGLDLDGNGMTDNALGNVLATLAGMGFDSQTAVTTQIDTGAILMLADLQVTSFTDATNSAFTIYVGTNPMPPPCSSPSDTTCRHHLDGTGTFDVAATPRDTPLAGAVASDTLTAGPGHLPVELVFAGGTPVTIDLIGARVKLDPTATTITSGIIAGGVSQTELDTTVYPGVQAAVTAQIAIDCTALASPPGCGCASGSNGATLISLFDTNHDCAVSVDEIENNTLIQILFAPDVTLEGQMCLSLGVGFTAVPGTFTP
ncbi:MAG TPA: hypothetical protein VGF94_18225 [Kofleriaceae bacterium]|jgi:hypothetical protein